VIQHRSIALSGLACLLLVTSIVTAQETSSPSFDCAGVAADSIEGLVCSDADLSALDRSLADTYATAMAKATDTASLLRTEQRGWISGRDDCWKSDDEAACVRTEYERRIAELQATYRLVASTGPVFYACDGNVANEVVATFFETEPPTLIAERGDSVSLMFLERSASGSRYAGRNESLWSRGNEALVVWGYEAPRMRCTERQ
jgi:uncharacterized protein